MGVIVNLDDSPMFRKQVKSMEQTADVLKNRCDILSEGCKKFMEALGESCNGYHAFADCLEEFGGGRDDPVSISIGGPVMSKFISALHELATCKELLRSQVEHTLLDRLTRFLNVDMQDAKEAREHFNNSGQSYDQARDKFMSLKKNTRDDIVAGLEEDMENSKSAFENSRFHLVSELMNVEAKKKYEFLESISAMMDAHLRFFKLGYDLLSRMEPYVFQVLTYAHQSKELANVEQHKLEKRIQEFRTQAELKNTVAFSDFAPSVSTDGNNVGSKSTYKNIEAMMQATTSGEVKTIKRGYLLKRSSHSKGDWKRRFFVLDSQGTLYYYRTNGTRQMGLASYHSSSSFDPDSSMFSRFRGRHNRSPSFNDEIRGCHTVDLQTSTIKSEADDTDLRLCFKIVSPVKTYTLQAENGADRLDWINKITAVITSLLNTNFLQQKQPAKNVLGQSGTHNDDQVLDSNNSVKNDMNVDQGVSVSETLREVPGNEYCAECSCPDPDWASLNLGILMCIECSGAHRNLGVHISKVRSLSLDVKVWEPAIMDLFRSLGNTYCNSIWEGLLHLEKGSTQRIGDEANPIRTSIQKPCSLDTTCTKEKYIHAKYVEKSLVAREATASGISSDTSIWQAVQTDNVREVYRLIVMTDANINTIFDDVIDADLYHYVDAHESESDFERVDRNKNDPATCQWIKESHESGSCFQGCSLLHLACHNGNQVMVELLLQFGADTNLVDYHGRAPLHHCISRGNNELAKFLIRRGACPSIKDGGGQTAMERAMELGAVSDEKLFILLTESG